MLKRIVTVLVIIILAVSGFFIFRNVKSDKESRHDEYIKMNKELSPLYDEETALESERIALDKEYKNTKNGVGTVQLLITEPSLDVYTEIYPVMQEYKDVKAVIGVSVERMPGERGMLSISAAEKLINADWSFCYAFNSDELKKHNSDKKSMVSWLRAIAKKADKLGIHLQPAVYFKDGDYRKRYAEWLKSYGIKVIIHHGEDNEHTLITDEADEDMWYPGASPWNVNGVADQLDIVTDEGSNFIFTIGGGSSSERYVETTFHSMLKKFKTNIDEEKLLVTNFEEMIELQSTEVSEEYRKQYDERLESISLRLKEVKSKIAEIIRKYDGLY